MDLREAIYSRRAVREFTSEPVSEEVLRELIHAAVQAPSAVNEQPWSFTVVRDKTVLQKISKESKRFMLQRPPAGIPAERIRELLTDASFDIFYGAPALVIISNTHEDQWTVENCTLAAQNLMLAARAAGLGTCWIGFAQMWLNTPEGKAALQIPATHVAVAPIIVGHPRGTPAPVHRREPEIHWVG